MSEFDIRDGVLVHYNGNDRVINIPNDVIAIGAHAFRGCESIEQIIIENNCTVMRSGAFAECPNLKSVIVRGMEISMLQ